MIVSFFIIVTCYVSTIILLFHENIFRYGNMGLVLYIGTDYVGNDT